jgi:abhydrolase domain-containing protein 17
MVIHGRRDEEVHFHHGREMYEAIPEQYKREPWWVSDRGHNDITEGSSKLEEYIRKLRHFLSNLDSEL